MTPEEKAWDAFRALRSDVEQFDDHPAQGDSGLFSEKVPLALKSYLVNWLRRFMAEHGDVVEAALSAPPSKEALRDVERETLERAAKIASDLALKEQKLRDASDDDDAVSSAESRRVTAAYIAQSIRSLLQKEGG